MLVKVDMPGRERTARALRAAPREIKRRWKATLWQAGQRMVNTIKTTYRGAAETTDRATAVRTGRLRREVSADVDERNGLELRIGWMRPRASDKALEYAATHEYGATIRPKRSRYLAIPLDKTRRGAARADSPRAYVDTFPIRLRDGRLFLAQRYFRNGSGAQRLRMLYRLHPGPIRIPPRPSLMPALEEHRRPLEDQLLADAIAATEGA